MHKFNRDKKWCCCISTMKWPRGIWLSSFTLHEVKFQVLTVNKRTFFFIIPEILQNIWNWWCHFLENRIRKFQITFNPKQSEGLDLFANFRQNFVDNKGPLSIIVYIYSICIQTKSPLENFSPSWYFTLKCLDFTRQNLQNNSNCDLTLKYCMKEEILY